MIKSVKKPKVINEDTFHENKSCERCGCPVPDNVNETPDGHTYCDEDLSMDDIFGEDDDYEFDTDYGDEEEDD